MTKMAKRREARRNGGLQENMAQVIEKEGRLGQQTRSRYLKAPPLTIITHCYAMSELGMYITQLTTFMAE